ncbi:peroxisomal membrane protein PMP47B [Choiromyces venosus 120613-1]|uniref:Peroxisomal membrane protein PMP47B n=1 Tax=Choiromyces venosus 120613-1 TaxID=1336337 RepID=A0A3N4JNX4_9PEZI|nr:peroxisomal membrane protein PMP47B [Choiromyces venosus 120613-1]
MSSAQSDNVLHAIAGAGGGVLSMVLTYPLITLSTRSQVESKRAHSTVLDAIRRIIQREGLSGLYAGLDSAIFGISVTNFVYYYWYEWSRTAFEKAALKAGRSRSKLTTLEAIAAGALAGSATVLITNPIWVVNTRMTARKRAVAPTGEKAAPSSSSGNLPTLQDPTGQASTKAPSTISTIRQLFREGGIGQFFAGVIPALVLVINPILQYTIFEQLKNVLERRKKRSATPQDAFFLGALGKLVATALTYPYITVKSRMHVAEKSEKKRSVFESLRKILREEGWAGLYGGIGPKLVQSVLTAAFLFAFKDALYAFTATALANRRASAKLKAT